MSHDLLKKTIRPQITDKQELLAARLAAMVAVLVAGYLGMHPPDYVAAVVALAFGLACASFFPAIIMGIFYQRMNKYGGHKWYVSGPDLHHKLYRGTLSFWEVNRNIG